MWANHQKIIIIKSSQNALEAKFYKGLTKKTKTAT